MITRIPLRGEEGSLSGSAGGRSSPGTAESRKNVEQLLAESLPGQRFRSFAASQAAELQESIPVGFLRATGAASPSSSAGTRANPLFSLSGREKTRQVDLEVELARGKAELSSLRAQLEQAQTRQKERDVLQTRVEQLSGEKRALQAGLQSAQESAATAAAQLEQERTRSHRFEQSLREAMEKSGAVLRLDRAGQRVISAEEHQALKAAEEAHHRSRALEKERDRLSLDNFELRRELGRNALAEEVEEELLRLRVKSALHISELETAKQRQRAGLLEEELRLVRSELTLLRSPSSAETASYTTLIDQHAREILRLRHDNETLAAAVWRLQKEQQGLLLSTLDVNDPAELKKIVVFLRNENKRLSAAKEQQDATERKKQLENVSLTAVQLENEVLRGKVAELERIARQHASVVRPSAPRPSAPSEARPSSLKQSLMGRLRKFI